MTEFTVERTTFQTWDDCLRLSNGVVELVVTVGCGPRILSFGLSSGGNLLYTDEDQDAAAGDHVIHGGHRLWYDGEGFDRTYPPDEDAVAWSRTGSGIEFIKPTEKTTGIRKRLVVSFRTGEATVEVTPEIENDGVWSIQCAPWAITMLRSGGVAVVPFSCGDPDSLLPDRSLTMWPYTDVDDERLSFETGLMLIDQSTEGDSIKVGTSGTDGWVGYAVDGTALVREFDHDPTATYPDRGSVVEVYADSGHAELEIFGPLSPLSPGESKTHTETWRLIDEVGPLGPDTPPTEIRTRLTGR